MAVRTSSAVWQGGLKEGQGTMKLGSGTFEGAYSFGTRFEEDRGTNPEELIGAAHAGCFSMALAGQLGRAGYTPRRIESTARVHLEKQGEGFGIGRVELRTEADVPGIEEAEFEKIAQAAKEGCPVSRVLRATIELDARLRR